MNAAQAVARWLFPWWPEFRRRWPCIVGVLRGSTVIFAATIGPPDKAMVTITRSSSVVMDTIITGAGSGCAVRFDGEAAS